MNAEDFRLLYDYNSWANHRTLDTCSQLNAEQFTRDMGSSFRSVRDTLVHIMLVERLWLERWHGRSPNSYAPTSEFPNVDSVRARWAEIDSDLLDYIISAALLFYILTIAAVVVLRYKRPDAERLYRTPGYPVVPAIYVLGASTVVLCLFIDRPATTWPGLVLVIAGLPVYWLIRRKA